MKKLAIAFAMSMIVHSAAFAASGVVELKIVKTEDGKSGCTVTVEAVNKTASVAAAVRFPASRPNHWGSAGCARIQRDP